MISSTHLLSLCLTLSLLFVGGDSVTCHKCNSVDNSGCGSTMTGSQGTCTGSVCFTFTGTYDGDYIVMRDCLSSGSANSCTNVNTVYDGSRIIGKYCYCTSNYCNGGTSPRQELTVVFVLATLSSMLALMN
jgi:hypothetical protein